MKKISIYLSTVILLSIAIWSCSRQDTDEAVDRNNETVIYQKSTLVKSETQKSTSTSVGKTLNLQERITKVSVIKFENDIFDQIRDSEEWKEISKNFSIDKVDIKKTIIEGSNTILISVPFKSKEESGQFNIYKTGTNIRYTKMSILAKADGRNNYKISLSDNSQLLNMDIDKDMRIYDYSTTTKPSLSKMTFEGDEEGETGIGGDGATGELDCFKKDVSYLNCIKCLIADHCGKDGACFIACMIYPYVCLGIAILACLPA